MNEEILRIERSIRELFPKGVPFRPFVAFNPELDSIYIVTRDCSVTEIPVSKRISILEDNYPTPGELEYVGIAWHGVNHFCKSHGLPDTYLLEGFTELLNKFIARSKAEEVEQWVNSIARSIKK